MRSIDAIKNVLLVDDDLNITYLTKLALEGLTDWNVESVASGEEALQKAECSMPDLILLDVMMPGMDGRTTYARLKERFSLTSTHVIFVTAKVQPQEIDQYRKLGADGVITKPFDPLNLPEEIDHIISQAQSTPREVNAPS